MIVAWRMLELTWAMIVIGRDQFIKWRGDHDQSSDEGDDGEMRWLLIVWQ